MEMPVGTSKEWGSGVANSQDEVARADYSRLRLFTVERVVAGQPQRDVRGYWAARPQTVTNFSAVGYLFGRELLRVVGAPDLG